jgi:hypothetical protein
MSHPNGLIVHSAKLRGSDTGVVFEEVAILD